MLDTYDPNIRWANHTIEITYQTWKYTFVATVEMGGNCRGMALLKDAVQIHADKLYDEQGPIPTLIMTAPDGDTLENECDEFSNDTNEEPDIERWLEDMCVSVKFIKHERET